MVKSMPHPKTLPSDVANVYKNDGWISWCDYLGSENDKWAKKGLMPFEDMRTFIRSLGLDTEEDWKRWLKVNKRPDGIPRAIHLVYKDRGWTNWPDVLGTNRPPNGTKYAPYHEFVQIVRKEQRNGRRLITSMDYRNWTMELDFPMHLIPRHPETYYKKN